MRLALTVVSPAARRTADVVVEADPATPVADIAAELERFISGGDMERAQSRPAAVASRGRRCCGFPGRARRVRSPCHPRSRDAPLPVPLYVDYQRIPHS